MNDDYSGSEGSEDLVKEYVYKVVVVGNYSVGKTTFIRRLMKSVLPPEAAQPPAGDIRVSPTVGTDFFSHVVENVTPGQNVRLQIWDTAGLERYAAVHESTYRNASLVVCVFDVTDIRTLEDLMERHLTTASDFIPNLDQQNLVFIGNKLDLLVKSQGGSAQDASDPQKALAANARRSASTEAAFTSGLETGGAGASTHNADSDDEEEPVDLEAIVTMADVQTNVFSLLPDANYVEVSARTGQSVAEALDRICKVALFNDHALPQGWDPLSDSHDAFTQSALPRNRVLLRAAGLFREAGQPMPPQVQTTVPATVRPTAAEDSTPLPTPSELDHTAIPSTRAAKRPDPADSAATPPSSAASWRQTGAFSFDMAPPSQLDSTMNFSSDVFSPAERGDDGLPSARPSVRDGVGAAAQAPAVTKTSGSSPGAGATLSPEAKRLLRTPLSRLTPQEREARRALEHEEMKSMLFRGKNKEPASGLSSQEPLDASLGTQKPSSTFRDLDADADTAPPSAARPFRSLLDDETDRLAAERGANEPGESDDDVEDFQARLRARMDDIDKDASLKKIELKRAKDRDKEEKKKSKKNKGDKAVKADGKCSVCQCS